MYYYSQYDIEAQRIVTSNDWKQRTMDPYNISTYY